MTRKLSLTVPWVLLASLGVLQAQRPIKRDNPSPGEQTTATRHIGRPKYEDITVKRTRGHQDTTTAAHRVKVRFPWLPNSETK